MILYFNQLLYIKIVMAWFAYKFRVPSSLNSEHRARYSIIKSTSFSLTHTHKKNPPATVADTVSVPGFHSSILAREIP